MLRTGLGVVSNCCYVTCAACWLMISGNSCLLLFGLNCSKIGFRKNRFSIIYNWWCNRFHVQKPNLSNILSILSDNNKLRCSAMKRKAMFHLAYLHRQPFLIRQVLDDYVMFMNGHGKQINDYSANIFQLNWKYRHTDIRAFRRLSVQDSAYLLRFLIVTLFLMFCFDLHGLFTKFGTPVIHCKIGK